MEKEEGSAKTHARETAETPDAAACQYLRIKYILTLRIVKKNKGSDAINLKIGSITVNISL